MADDSLEIPENLEFHPCFSPRGMLFYDLKVLADSQQRELTNFKKSVMVSNYQYLAAHPEVRALVALVTRHVLKKCPRANVYNCIGDYFDMPRYVIQEEIDDYIKQKDIIEGSEGDSAVVYSDDVVCQVAALPSFSNSSTVTPASVVKFGNDKMTSSKIDAGEDDTQEDVQNVTMESRKSTETNQDDWASADWTYIGLD